MDLLSWVILFDLCILMLVYGSHHNEYSDFAHCYYGEVEHLNEVVECYHYDLSDLRNLWLHHTPKTLATKVPHISPQSSSTNKPLANRLLPNSP